MKKNIFSVGLVNLINGIAGIAFIPLAINSLNSEGYGIYSIFVILTSYIYFVEMGIAKYFTKLIAQSENIRTQTLNMQKAVSMYIKIAGVLLVITPILIVIVPLYIFQTDNPNLIRLIVLLASVDYLLSIPTTIRLTFNIGRENFKQVSKFTLVSGLSRHFMLIGTVMISKSVLILIFVILIRRLFDILYSKKILFDLPKNGWKPINVKGEFKYIIGHSLSLSAAQLTQVTILSLGTFLINKNFSLREVGIYKSVFDLSTKVWFISNSIGMVIFPRLAAILKNENEKGLLKNKIPFYYNVSWIGYNCLFLIITIIIIKVPYISNILGISDIKLFALLLLGACMNAHSNLSYEFLQADTKLKEVITTSVLTIAIMILSFYIFLNRFEIHAVGVSWVISQIINSMIMDTIVIKNINKSKIFLTIAVNFIITIFVLCWCGGNI